MSSTGAAAAAAATAAATTAHAGAKHAADEPCTEGVTRGEKRQRVDYSEDDLASFELWFKYGAADNSKISVSASSDHPTYTINSLFDLDENVKFVSGAAGIHGIRQALYRKSPNKEFCVTLGSHRYTVAHTFAVDAERKALIYDAPRVSLAPVVRSLPLTDICNIAETLRNLYALDNAMFTNGTPWQAHALMGYAVDHGGRVDRKLLNPRLEGDSVRLNDHGARIALSSIKGGKKPTPVNSADSSGSDDDDDVPS